MTMIALINKDSINGERTFLIKLYHNVDDIIYHRKPIGTHKCRNVLVDSDTLNYLNDVKEEEECH